MKTKGRSQRTPYDDLGLSDLPGLGSAARGKGGRSRPGLLGAGFRLAVNPYCRHSETAPGVVGLDPDRVGFTEVKTFPVILLVQG